MFPDSLFALAGEIFLAEIKNNSLTIRRYVV